MNFAACILALLLLVTPCASQASLPDSSGTPAPPHFQSVVLSSGEVPPPDTLGLIARTAFSLATVVLLIWGAVYLMRRLTGSRSPAGGRAHIRVLDRAYLAPKKAIYIVQIGSRSLAVGVTDGQMEALMELDHDETTAAYPTRATSTDGSPFGRLLKDVRAKLGGEDPVGGAS